MTKERHARIAALLAALSASACAFSDGAPAHGAAVLCKADGECPGGSSCFVERGVCLPAGTAPPVVIGPAHVAVDENASQAFALTAKPARATFRVIAPPQHAKLTCAADGKTCTVTPDQFFHGTDTLTVVAVDGQTSLAGAPLLSDPFVVTVDVAFVDQAPQILGPASLACVEDGSAILPLAPLVFEPDGESLTFTVTTSPTHGTAQLSEGVLLYTATQFNYDGPDAMTLSVSDGTFTLPMPVSIVVQAVDDPPAALAHDAIVEQGQAVDVALDGVSIDHDALFAVIKALPEHGTLSAALGDVVPLPGTTSYQAPLDYTGDDTFSFAVSEAGDVKESAPVVVHVAVRARLSASLAADATCSAACPSSCTTPEGTPIAVGIVGQVDGGGAGLTVKDAPTFGDAEIVDASFNGNQTLATLRYTPRGFSFGCDSLTVVATAPDGSTSDPLPIAIDVRPVEHAPTLAAISITTPEDTPVPFTLAGDDVDGDTLTYRLDGNVPPHLAFAVDGVALDPDTGKGTYTPASFAKGTDQFGVIVDDGHGGTASAVVSVVVTPVDHAPIALPVSVTMPGDTSAIVELEGSEVDGDAFHYEIVDAPLHGQIIVDGDSLRTFGVFVYAADFLFEGQDSLTYRVVDDTTAALASDTVPVTFDVTHVNHAPSLASATFLVPSASSAFNIQITPFDPDVRDGDTVSVRIVRPPTVGSLAKNPDGSFAYFHGVFGPFLDTTFTAIATDAAGLSSPETAFTISLTGRPSCSAIATARESIGDGVYLIDPGAPGGADRFLAYCDMTTAGGGWTLALRIDGRTNDFAFKKTIWDDDTTLNADDPGLDVSTPGKLATYAQVPVDEILVGMTAFHAVDGTTIDDGPLHYVHATLATGADSLLSLLALDPVGLVATPASDAPNEVARWEAIVSPDVVSSSCFIESTNTPSINSGPQVKIGITTGTGVAAGCTDSGPSSYIGVGASRSPAAGSFDTTGGTDTAFAVVLVRDHFAGSDIICGDGFKDGAEECDDGNTVDGDGCDHNCLVERCGDGRIEGLEECDDGNNVSNDGCHADCEQEFLVCGCFGTCEFVL